MRVWVKKFFKIVFYTCSLLFLVLLVFFYSFSRPKSNKKIIKEFAKIDQEVFISHKKYKSYSYRVLNFQKELDTSRLNIVFVHGSIGSAMDFKKYYSDSVLDSKVNFRSYDRIGYGPHQTGNVQESIAFEKELLEDLIVDMDKSKTILVGYSYGGPIVLASHFKYHKIVLIAPAVYSEVEYIPWAISFYKWKLTRWLLPAIWKAASKEKLSHSADLKLHEINWTDNSSEILSVHGNDDRIVPIENSLYLEEIFTPQQFEMLTLENVGHGLVWSEFDSIVKVLQNLVK